MEDGLLLMPRPAPPVVGAHCFRGEDVPPCSRVEGPPRKRVKHFPDVVAPPPFDASRIPVRFEDLPPDHVEVRRKPYVPRILPPVTWARGARQGHYRFRCGSGSDTDSDSDSDSDPDPDPESEARREAERDRIFRERNKPMYLCDGSAVQIMVKAATEGPSPLGAWVRKQLEAGCLWACTAVDAVPGWKVFTPDPRADSGEPRVVKGLFERIRGVGAGAMSNTELYDTVQTYARTHDTCVNEGASYVKWRRLVTGNRAFIELFLGTEVKRSHTFWELYLSARRSDPVVVMVVDDVHQEKPEGPLF